ncbi:GNAT family N-acetyltransferase [Corynebacterium sp.]|uniref:GNAT family N-acetyltransferase n=1 Tax=Corynebacterium sp. TaxID=1720 RepID=UPI0026DBF96F|nr:N-acetyltransferase [Corynebacterium sp.]MDO5031255.1 N-acetyltransferase [Corynebacterium sp.]
MRLRPLEAADAARCAELEKVLFPGESPWPARAFEQEIAAAHTFYIAVDEAPEDPEGADPAPPRPLLGYAGIGKLGPADSPEFEIHTIGVAPEAQRRGVARMMMDNIVYVADMYDAPVFLEVRVGNVPAISLYEAYGFIHTGIRRNYYQPSGADAHTMVRPRTSERNQR